MPNFWRVPLPGEQSNPGSRQYIYRFPDSCTVFWSNPESRKYPSRPFVNKNAHMAEAYPGLSSTKQVVLILLLLHPRWDATPPHGYPQHLTAEKIINK